MGDFWSASMNNGLFGRSDDGLADEPSPVRYLHPQPQAPIPHVYNELLSRLVGSRLQSIHFSGDYVQFFFGSVRSTQTPVLTCDVMPAVITPAGPIADGQVGYADALRWLIGDAVVGTAEAHSEGVRLEFGKGALVLRPTVGHVCGPVIAMLSDFGDGRSMTWRRGGESFEHLR
jgi:hypothetical protein